VERLIAPGVIDTMPDKTLRAFADHGNVERALGSDLAATEAVLSTVATEGLDLERITRELERGRRVLLRLLRGAAEPHRIQARLAYRDAVNL
jgi:hypothetical protein